MWEYTHYDELYHHGVKGMKWGVRKKEERVSRKKNKTSDTDTNEENASDTNKQKGLNPKVKKAIIIGTATVATALAAYGSYRLVKSGKLDNIIDNGKNKIQTLLKKNRENGLTVGELSIDESAIGKFKKLGSKETVEQAISKVNSSGSRNNCYNCVVATVGRLCGLDVTAKGDTQGGNGMSFDDVCRAFKLNPDNDTDVRRIMNPSVDKISNVISKKFKEGDVGAIGLSWNDAYKKPRGLSEAGHTLNWTVKNGRVEFMDGQANLSGERLKGFMSAFMDSGKEASIAKFANVSDGLSLDYDMLSKFAN